MATTAIIAEILIIGLQTLTWVMIGLLALRPDWSLTSWIDDLGPLTLLLAFAAAYVLGIVVDRTADTLLDERGVDAARRQTKSGNQKRTAETLGLGPKRIAIMSRENAISPFLEYQRSRLRITRATCLNLILAWIPTAAFVVRKGSAWEHEWRPVAGMTLAYALALWVTWRSYVRIYRAYMKRVDDAYDLVERRPSQQ